MIRYGKGLPGDGTTVIKQNWEDVVDYKIGGFYTFTDYLKIRGGYYKTASPIPEETLGPTTPDGAGRNSFYLGAGYKRRAFLMDLAYVMSDFLPSETRTNPDLTGKYNGERQCTAVERWLFLLSYRKWNRLCRISKCYGLVGTMPIAQRAFAVFHPSY